MSKILDNFIELNYLYFEGIRSPSPPPQRLEKEVDFFTTYLPEKTCVLDVGCGWGAAMDYLKKQGFVCFGTDISIYNLYVCMCKNLAVGWVDACNMYALDDGEADNIFCRTTLNYVYDIEKALNELYRVLKQGGVIYLSVGVGNRERWHVCFKSEDEVKNMLNKRFKCIAYKKSKYQDSDYIQYVGRKE